MTAGDRPSGIPADGTPRRDDDREPIVDLPRVARRMRVVLLALSCGVLLVWLAGGVLGAGFGARRLAELFGFGLFVALLAEVVVVGGAAVLGVLRAGERGDRLAGDDVGLFPPQLRRRPGARGAGRDA